VGRGEPGSLRAVALPTEHGGWGFTLEPVLLGLAVAPSRAGAGLAAAAGAVFLARRPLRLLLADLRGRRFLPRTATAGWVLGFCLAVTGAGLLTAALLATGPFWWALAAAVPAAAWQVGADVARRSREFLAEAAGAVAMGAVAPAIALAAGWEAAPAFGLWAVLAGRALPSILLVRAQIRRSKGEPAGPAPTHTAHDVALTALAGLAATGAVPWAAAGAIAALWAWAALSLARPPVPARTLGWAQMAVGLVVVAVTAAGHHLGW
jgi:hypothetical protein